MTVGVEWGGKRRYSNKPAYRPYHSHLINFLLFAALATLLVVCFAIGQAKVG